MFSTLAAVRTKTKKEGHMDDIKLPRQLNPHDLYNRVSSYFLYQFQHLRCFSPSVFFFHFILGINISQQNYFLLCSEEVLAYVVIILGNPTT